MDQLEEMAISCIILWVEQKLLLLKKVLHPLNQKNQILEAEKIQDPQHKVKLALQVNLLLLVQVE